jgi:hypothetical protein
VSKEARDLVAVILAIGLVSGLNFLMFAILWDALNSDTPGISENATQILIGWGGGIIGILGGYVGFKAGHSTGRQDVENEIRDLDHSDQSVTDQ